MTAAVIALVALAAVGGIAYNRLVWRPRQEDGRSSGDGLAIKEVTGPLVSLAVLLVADPDLRDQVRGDVICYSTAVIEQEWPAMAEGRYSNVPAYWAAQVRRTAIRQVRSGNDERAGTAVLDRDRERTVGRQDRLNEAGAGIPRAVHLLMLVAVVAAVVLIAVVTAKGVDPRVHVMVVVIAAMIFGAALLLIRGLDAPFSGMTGRQPGQTESVREQMLAEVVDEELPCDDKGLPLDDPLFLPRTSPLE